MKKKAKITYRQVGDYLIPNLKLPPEETKVTLGKWGILYKDHLQKHKSPLPAIFAIILVATVVAIVLSLAMAKQVTEPLMKLDLEHPADNVA